MLVLIVIFLGIDQVINFKDHLGLMVDTIQLIHLIMGRIDEGLITMEMILWGLISLEIQSKIIDLNCLKDQIHHLIHFKEVEMEDLEEGLEADLVADSADKIISFEQ